MVQSIILSNQCNDSEWLFLSFFAWTSIMTWDTLSLYDILGLVE